MTDTPSSNMGNLASAPISIASNPAQYQVESLLRSIVAALSLITAAFGLAKATGVLHQIADLASPIVAVLFGLIGIATIIIDLFRTHKLAKAAQPGQAVVSKASWLAGWPK